MPRTRKSAVEIHLASGVRLPISILGQRTKIELIPKWVGGKYFRTLRIRGGKASFTLDGDAAIVMPNSESWG